MSNYDPEVEKALASLRITQRQQEQAQYAAAPSMGGACDPCAKAYARPTFRDTLQEIISSLRLKLNQLEALQRALPVEMPLPADEILQQLLNQLRANRPDKY